MKLLVVSQYFYPENFRINDVCFTLAQQGHEVTVLTGLPNYPMGEIFEGYEWKNLKSPIEYVNGVQVIRCNMRPRMTGTKNLALNYWSFWHEASKAAKQLAKTEDFDKILIFQYSPVTMAIPAIKFKKASKSSAPLLIYCFDLWPESIVSAGLPGHGPIYAAVKILSKYIYKKADKILVSSRNFEKYFDQKLGIRGNIEYLPIYAEDVFAAQDSGDGDVTGVASEVEDSRIADSEKVRFLFAGNIGEMQSVDTIVRAAGILQERGNYNIHIDIVGDGSAYKENLALADELKLENVTFHGRHPVSEMNRFYDMADAFLITLKNDPFISYTLPGKVQSYMAAGKPLIGSIAGETAEVINLSGCGLYAAPEEPQSLAEIMLDFAAKNKEERRKLGALARQYYENNFSKEKFFERIEEVL